MWQTSHKMLQLPTDCRKLHLDSRLNGPAAMKLAVITDIHHSATGPSIVTLVERFVACAIDAGADLLLDLGDRIDDADRDTDLALLSELAAIFRRFRGPRLHLVGNHDVVNLTDDHHARLLGRRPGHHVHDLGDMRLVIWEPSVVFRRPEGFAATAENLDWLIATLSTDPRPAIVASHVPVSGAAMTGNYYFEKNPSLAAYPDAAAVRAAVEATGNAALWLSGHVHWNSFSTVGNLRHVTLQSPSETFTTLPGRALTWAMLDIADGRSQLRIEGRDPWNICFPFVRSGAAPWPAVRAPIE